MISKNSLKDINTGDIYNHTSFIPCLQDTFFDSNHLKAIFRKGVLLSQNKELGENRNVPGRSRPQKSVKIFHLVGVGAGSCPVRRSVMTVLPTAVRMTHQRAVFTNSLFSSVLGRRPSCT